MIPSQRPILPAQTLGVLQTRPVQPRQPETGPAPNPNLRERPIIDPAGAATTPTRGSLVNILV